jgi:hypothetical protein
LAEKQVNFLLYNIRRCDKRGSETGYRKGREMQTAIWFEIDDVKTALERLSVPLAVLQEAVQAGYVSRISRTSNDAPNAAGV